VFEEWRNLLIPLPKANQAESDGYTLAI
jgi:hypothetical protein